MRRHRRFLVFLLLVIGAAATLAPGTPAAGQAPPEASGSSDWRVVDGGGSHTCAIKTSGELFCWGRNVEGQIGRGTANTSYPTPVEAVPGATDWTAVSAGGYFTCGIRRPGRLFCWGDDDHGELGNGGTNTAQPAPVRVGVAQDWTSVSAGYYNACGRRSNGRIYCWGRDDYGQVGNGGTNTDRHVPTTAAGGFTDWVAVDASTSGYHACGLRRTGRLYCWGLDDQQQLGNGGAAQNRGTPGPVAGGITNWTSVAVGGYHSCARRADARLYCWGIDENGQLGNDATLADRATPQVVAGGASWTAVSSGWRHTCGRKRTGRLYCWGSDNFDQLGAADVGGQSPVPVQVAGGATDWTQFSLGEDHSCSRTTAGRLYCWGYGNDGATGNGNSDGSSWPEEVFYP